MTSVEAGPDIERAPALLGQTVAVIGGTWASGSRRPAVRARRAPT